MWITIHYNNFYCNNYFYTSDTYFFCFLFFLSKIEDFCQNTSEKMYKKKRKRKESMNGEPPKKKKKVCKCIFVFYMICVICV